MPSDPKIIEFDFAVLEQLACPACLGELRLVQSAPGDATLVCGACGRNYRIVGGIPVLIADVGARAVSEYT